MATWLDDVGFVPLLDSELLTVRHALAERAGTLRSEGFNAHAEQFERLLEKLSGELHGRDYKIVPLTESDRNLF